ncbi:MAG: 50S ribosomal protein L16 [Candidatus Brennerbacteria bacterium RIFOXYC1_FULL_41_11]|uniref:Large ribosomal subunit protein uL16 n=1 Tax=Candidatus Brennerbacteria bacterium RIFOXYD1_FULL_41_16 TaxID=1797529 RepID=A0A1G1XJR8_9BACT|nr:MAG: 50S ribosomal protein L16 [Parcubacteria group bacterium GW2011_GWB1_41_4]OGY38765.1 MAG: 50S ribosomal protein L16 [Candidatus Brennerbacteria bacterium RIFOXYB1_FULL_41_13]OGY39048.1 MAG: 50S ribosomal protein L16 [Candidatus Brennerbacteria bacterium RIFOXYC1_FULL_41_11]OGY40201.1 MAG: 50S ribosomal protein L16 [Candidatus Brennerbacteria bacterium RIFOXYD1_FULL_41_16]
MLAPKKMKHKKWNRGRSRSRLVETRGKDLAFGEFGLQALEAVWMTANQIESARKVISKYVKKGGKMWIRIFPDKPVTQKPPEVTMGSGKGAVDHYVFPVKPGRVIFEVSGVSKDLAEKALNQAGYKLPFKTKIISE